MALYSYTPSTGAFPGMPGNPETTYGRPSYTPATPIPSVGTPPTAAPYGNFVPPDPSAINTDPSFKFRLSQGTQALQNAAAARGTLLTGATAKGLEDYGQNAAAQEYGNIYGRALDTYDTNRDTSSLNFGHNLETFNAALGATGQAQNFSLGSSRLGLEANQQGWQQGFTQNLAAHDNAREAWLDAGGIGPLYGGYAQPNAPPNYSSVARQHALMPPPIPTPVAMGHPGFTPAPGFSLGRATYGRQ